MKLCGFEAGIDQPFFLIAGPCVVESEALQIINKGLVEGNTELYERLKALSPEAAAKYAESLEFIQAAGKANVGPQDEAWWEVIAASRGISRVEVNGKPQWIVEQGKTPTGKDRKPKIYDSPSLAVKDASIKALYGDSLADVDPLLRSTVGEGKAQTFSVNVVQNVPLEKIPVSSHLDSFKRSEGSAFNDSQVNRLISNINKDLGLVDEAL